MAPYRGAKIITYHPSWPNFTRHFGLQVAGTVEPKPGIPPSPSHTLDLINLIKDQKIKAIIMEPYFDRKTPNFIGEKTGAKVVVLYPSVGGKADLTDYFKLFDYDLNELRKALK
jgi:zinc/manganese transport system substrate-binding protein